MMSVKSKNIHVLPTDKASRVLYNSTLKSFCIQKEIDGMFINDGKVSGADFWGLEKALNNGFKPQHIYITSYEEIKEGDKFIFNNHVLYKGAKKIILTTDQDLIKDGVQAIDDEFLEWFVNNPSCEEVEVEKYNGFKTEKAGESWLFENDKYNWKGDSLDYKIIIPKEEPNQETLEEFAKQEAIKQYSEDTFGNLIVRKSIEKGAKWQQERIQNLRDELYNQLPIGEVHAFDLIKVINSHIKKLDKLI